MTHQELPVEQPVVYRLLFENMTQGFALHEIILDGSGKPVDYRFLSVNAAFEAMTGLKRENIVGKTVLTVLPNTESYWIEIYGKVALTGVPCRFQNYSQETAKYFDVWSFSPQTGQFATVITDITAQTELEKKLKHVYYHDVLTGLYNKQYLYDSALMFDNATQKPLSVIAVTINELQSINESFGYPCGDEAIKRVAQAIRECCRSMDTPARWEGGMFFLLAPGTEESAASALARRIKSRTSAESSGSPSIVPVSVGLYCRRNDGVDLMTALKLAEKAIERDGSPKLHLSQNAPIRLILQALHEKNKREEQHSQRVSRLCALIGRGMGLDEETVEKLSLIGLVHDIGKIGVDESLLNKAEPLTPEEFDAIKKHAEIGFRILSASSQTAEIGFYVLSHHERLDGAGYPNGIKGESISLYTRILSVADSYDAMTTKRPYCAEKKQEEAFEELRRCAGTQLDSSVVEVLIGELQAGHPR